MTPRAPDIPGKSKVRSEDTFILLRPRVFFPSLVAVIAIAVLLAPAQEGGNTASPLTTYANGPGGVSALADAANRLGWQVTQLETPLSDSLPADRIYAELAPAIDLTSHEVHTLLNKVREGAGLFVLVSDRLLEDSLHVRAGRHEGRFVRDPIDTVECPPQRQAINRFSTNLNPYFVGIEPTAPLGDTVHLARFRRDAIADTSAARFLPAAIGMPLGRGRIVVAADVELVTNDNIRVCRRGFSIATIRMFEWLSRRDDGPPRRVIVFDEFHQGFGNHGSTMAAIRHWFARTPSGRVGVQIAIAALILLAAFAPRPVPPLATTVIQRRSPLEHVAALAQAYEQARASKTATRLLLQGVKRRTARALATRAPSDAELLASATARTPAVAPDAERVTSALATTVTPAALLDVTASIDRIERSIRS